MTMTIQINQSKLLDDIKSSGYCLSQLFIAVAKWTNDNATHDIKVAMRDGEPIMCAAQYLSKKDDLDIARWSEVWTNHKSMRAYHNIKCPKVTEYFSQQGMIGKPFTLVDVGYSGSIPKKFHDMGEQVQALFITLQYPKIPVPKKAFFQEHQIPQRALAIHGKCDKTSFLRLMNGSYNAEICLGIIERIPKNYEYWNATDFRATKNILVPSPKKTSTVCQERYKAFYAGLSDGFADCYQSHKRNDENQWNTYIDTLLRILPHIHDTFDLSMRNTYFDDIVLTGKLHETMPQAKQQIQDIYKSLELSVSGKATQLKDTSTGLKPTKSQLVK